MPRVGRVVGLVGAPAMLRDPCAHLAAVAARHGDCFVYPFGGMAETLVVVRPAIALAVLKDADSFGKSDIQTRHMQDFLGPGLLTLAGDPWRRQRRLISGGFRTDRIATMAAPLQVDVDHGLDRLQTDAATGPVDVSAAMMRLAFAAVARSLLGAEVAVDNIECISDAITAVQAYLVRQIVLPWAAPLFRATGDHGRHQALRRGGDAIVAAVVDARSQRGARAADAPDADMLDRLLGADDPVSGVPMTRDAVVAEIMQLLVAGHETSSTVLAWTLWLLARHPAALAALREELAGDHGDAAGAVHRLPLMVATLKEAMRLYPPFWLIDRLALADTVLDGVAIAAGTRIALFVHGLHHRADYWDAPGQFRPERFLGDARANERNGAFLPFGSGPRTCVGSNYAWLQMVTILSAMITRFDLRARDAEVLPEALLILRAKGGIWLHLVPRP